MYCVALAAIILFLASRALLKPAPPGSPSLAAKKTLLAPLLRAAAPPATMEELRAEIARAGAAGTLELDWANRGLTALPEEIGSLTRLEKLNLAGNELSDLPEALASCTALRTLFFLNNRFTAVPSVLGRLPALSMLSFKSNRVEHIPEDALPPSLAWLILTDNALAALPAALGRLPRLRKLMLASNQLRALPDMSGLAALELVRLSDNHLQEFPEALLQLPRLAWLAVAGNDFEPMPRAAVAGRLAAARSALTMDNVQLGEVLGEGTSGVVYAAKRLDGGGSGSGGGGGEGSSGCSGQDKVAVKVFKAASSDGRPVDEVRRQPACPGRARGRHPSPPRPFIPPPLSPPPAATQVAVSLALTSPHPNLINLLGFVAEAGEGAAHYSKLASFLEFCSGMKVLAKPPSFASVTRDVYPAAPGAIQGLSVAQAGVVALAVASAAAHLHAAGVAHGDLYGHNLLLDPALVGPGAAGAGAAGALAALAARVKLGDLGAAFFYQAGSARGALIERVEVRAWACLAEELLALAAPGAPAGSAEAALAAALADLGRACGAEGGSVAARPGFAEIVDALSGPVRAAVAAAPA